MLICIKGGAREPMWKIPLPFFFFCNLLVKEKVFLKLAAWCEEKHPDQSDLDIQAFIKGIDYNQLRETLRELRKYQGLKLVDVKSAKGEIVRIVI